MAIHQENFVSLRRLYPRVTERVGSTRMAVAEPGSETERDYRDLLSEANLNFFHREYSIALQNYLSLRQRILEQSHPEMPKLPGGGLHLELDWSKASVAQLMELSRRVATKVPPGDPVRIPLTSERLIKAGEVPVNAAFTKFSAVGIRATTVSKAEILAQRDRARELVAAGKWKDAAREYAAASTKATDAGDIALAADLANESAAVITTFANGPDRPAALRDALTSITRAEQLFLRTGDLEATDIARANRANIQHEIDGISGGAPTPGGPIGGGHGAGPIGAGPIGAGPIGGGPVGAAPLGVAAAVAAPVASARTVTLAGGGRLAVSDLLRADTTLGTTALRVGAVQPQATRVLMVRDAAGWTTAPVLVDATAAAATPAAAQIGLFSPAGAKTLSLDSTRFANALTTTVYQTRIAATTLEDLNFYEIIDVNFVSYFVHLYFFVLPIAIGDSYAAMGLYDKALKEYRSVLTYPFLNVGIELRYVWLKMANAYLRWGNTLFRREQRVAAREKFERIVRTDLTAPPGSELYQGKFAPMLADLTEVVKELKGQAHAATNPNVAAVVTQATIRLKYIAQNFNFFGIGVDYAPVLRFKYLQSVATYLADSAIEAERTFIGYRSTAETQKIERLQLESAVDVNKAALDIENKRMEDAALEVEAAKRTREYSEVRKRNADDALTEWDTKGKELTSMNAALSWASNAANDQDIKYTGVRYDGGRHDYEGDVEDFFDTVGEKKEWLDWELQRNRIVRQQAEIAAEVAMAQTREQQAKVRFEVQQLNVTLAQKRLDGSQEVLEYAEDRLFDEDLWFQLAAQLQDLAQGYLDSAIYAALVMERAYELEFDRRLHRIRTDYGLGSPAGLLGGDHLKSDIISFTSDYLEHAQKKNPVRLALSLREEFPSGFNTFVETGIFPFRTDLEIFDRRYPGTMSRKLKKIEVFVEGLVPLEGASGFLMTTGVCAEWRESAGTWSKRIRVMPVERAVMSSYQFRRDIAVFAPSEELLGLFENMSPQTEWTLEIPRSSNNLDYSAISDVKFVVYFDADYSDSLAAHVKTLYPTTGAKSTVLSSRFQYPDEYFRLDAERSVDFQIDTTALWFNYESPKLTALGVRVLPANGGSVANLPLTLVRVSDDASVAVTTNMSGAVPSAPGTMNPFGAWKNASPLDTWRVQLGVGVDPATIADIQLFYTYAFNYRADGTL